MTKKEIKVLAILAAVIIVGLAALFVINNYRGDDGLTYSERKHLEKNGEAVVDWQAMEEAQNEDDFFARLFNNGNKDQEGGSDTASTNKDDSGSKDTDTDSSKGDSDDDSTSGSDQDSSSDNDDADSGLSGDAREYADYIAMSPEDQEEYFETFDSPDDFIKWFNNAKAEYEASDSSVKVEGGGIDISDYQ